MSNGDEQLNKIKTLFHYQLFLSKMVHMHDQQAGASFQLEAQNYHQESSVLSHLNHSMGTVWASSHHGDQLHQQVFQDTGSLLWPEPRKWYIIPTIIYSSSSHVVHQDSRAWDTDHTSWRRTVREIMTSLIYHRPQYLTCIILIMVTCFISRKDWKQPKHSSLGWNKLI